MVGWTSAKVLLPSKAWRNLWHFFTNRIVRHRSNHTTKMITARLEDLWRQAETVEVVQAGEEKAPGRSYSTFQYLKVPCKRPRKELFTRACNDKTRGNGLNRKRSHIRSRSHIRKKLLIMRVVRHPIGLPRKAVEAPSMEYSKPGCMVLWATCYKGWCPCP